MTRGAGHRITRPPAGVILLVLPASGAVLAAGREDVMPQNGGNAEGSPGATGGAGNGANDMPDPEQARGNDEGAPTVINGTWSFSLDGTAWLTAELTYVPSDEHHNVHSSPTVPSLPGNTSGTSVSFQYDDMIENKKGDPDG